MTLIIQKIYEENNVHNTGKLTVDHKLVLKTTGFIKTLGFIMISLIISFS